jgi:hypothetical protein
MSGLDRWNDRSFSKQIKVIFIDHLGVFYAPAFVIFAT